ncbi:uncharacterized protein MAM_06892 [Metarhizium album ARSEF 1941]|uniref:Tat pathway signal sequence n=1 Tax=Metarhizium album (strain ARSEF 1941) TaxID=1081103 RepID=A0A0B2WGQ3_METAS|nr:uncharacterized protein MAM_06892 [Metarhizium album ARSEF 1941]KHN95181.1 hypothetical protein MAM_06892 [Metarhizium album ARSEF 1941]
MASIRYERLRATAKPEPEPADDDEDNCGNKMMAMTTATTERKPIWTRRQATLAFVGNAMLLIASIFLLSAAAGRKPSPSHLECAQMVSPYSPMWEAVEFWEGNFANEFNSSTKYRGPPTLERERAWNDLWRSPMWEAVEFWEGNFANEFNSSTKYRGPPTLERERAWNDLWRYHLIPVDAAGVAALNQTRAGTHPQVKGSDPAKPQYGATIEVFHQLHCLVSLHLHLHLPLPLHPPLHCTCTCTCHAALPPLVVYHHSHQLTPPTTLQNVLRQYSWPLDMFDPSWGADLYPSMLRDAATGRTHVDHCIEALRLSLMCAGDITPVLFLRDAASPLGVRADFNVHHKCRAFDKIVAHVKANGVELDV